MRKWANEKAVSPWVFSHCLLVKLCCQLAICIVTRKWYIFQTETEKNVFPIAVTFSYNTFIVCYEQAQKNDSISLQTRINIFTKENAPIHPIRSLITTSVNTIHLDIPIEVKILSKAIVSSGTCVFDIIFAFIMSIIIKTVRDPKQYIAIFNFCVIYHFHIPWSCWVLNLQSRKCLS